MRGGGLRLRRRRARRHLWSTTAAGEEAEVTFFLRFLFSLSLSLSPAFSSLYFFFLSALPNLLPVTGRPLKAAAAAAAAAASVAIAASPRVVVIIKKKKRTKRAAAAATAKKPSTPPLPSRSPERRRKAVFALRAPLE